MVLVNDILYFCENIFTVSKKCIKCISSCNILVLY